MKRTLLSLLAMLAAAAPAFSAIRTWTGAAPAGPFQHDWSNGANWSGGIDAESGDLAVFPAGATYTGPILQNLGTQFSDLQGLIFQAPGYELHEEPVSVSGTLAADFTATGSVVLNVAVKLDTASMFSVNSSRATLELNREVVLNAKTLTVAGAGILQLDGPVNGLGNLVKNGTGRMEINGAMPQGGGFSLTAGTVLCNHAVMAKPVNVSGTGNLGGTGTVLNVTLSGGSITPGVNNSGTLTVTGSAQLNAAASVNSYITSGSPGGSTLLVTQGGFTAGGGTLGLTFHPAYVPYVGQVITLVDNQSMNAVSGTFAGLPEGSTLTQGGVQYRVSYAGGTGNDVTLTTTGVLPTGVERVWTGAVDTFWSTPGNWSGNIAPRPGDSVQFPDVPAAKKANVNTFAQGYPLHLVRFTAGGYSITGNALHITDRIVQQAPAGAAANAVKFALHAPAAASKTTTVRLQSGGDLLLEPPAPMPQPFSSNVLLLQNDSAAALLTSRIPLAGAGLLAKSGSGPVLLDAASAHSGGVRVYEGELRAVQPNRLGPGLVGIDAPATLVTGMPGGAYPDFTNTADISGALRCAGDTRWTGPLYTQTGQNARFIAPAFQKLQLDCVIAGSGSVRFEGGGDTYLKGSAANTWTGATMLDHSYVHAAKTAGTVSLPGSVTVNSGRLEVDTAQQIADGATVEAADSAVYFHAPETIAALRLNNGAARAYAPLTVTGSIETLAHAQPSFITGTIVGGSAPVAWITANGAAEPDLEFDGTLAHGPATGARFTCSGAGKLRVLDGAAADHADVELTLNAGTLEWNDLPAAAFPFGPAVALNGGTLTGTGCVRSVGALNGGTLAPGGAPGIFQSGSVALRPGTAFHVESNGSALDQLQVTGTVDLNSAALVLSGPAPAYGQPVVILANDGSDAINGTFSTLPEGGQQFLGTALMRISYTGGDGNDVTLTRVPPPAPEDPVISLGGWMQDPAHNPVTASGEGLPGFSYALEMSEDLTAWQAVQTRAADANGQLSLQWTPPAGLPRLFLRIRAL